MKRILLILFCIVATLAKAQQSPRVLLSEDSLGRNLSAHWLCRFADSPVFASPAFSDTSWERVNAKYLKEDSLSRVVWLRLYLRIDSSLLGLPIAFCVSQLGASEIYFDGRLIHRFGQVSPRDSVHYFDPQGRPFFLSFSDTSDHLLAVRYANYEARRNLRVFHSFMTGFNLTTKDADSLVADEYQSRFILTLGSSVLMGLFLAFSLLHLFLFLYLRSERSNLYYSIFSFCLSCLFFSALIVRYVNWPSWELVAVLSSFFITVVACLALNEFINEVFEKKRSLWKWVIRILAVIVALLRFVHFEASMLGLVVLILSVAFEALIITLIAIYKKVPGARILSVGLISFTGLILLVAILTFANGGYFEVDDTRTGMVWTFAILFAILSVPISMSVYLAYRFSRMNKNLQVQLEQVQVLSARTLAQEQENKRILQSQNEELERQVNIRTAEVLEQKNRVQQQHEELKVEKRKSDELLLNILPSEVAEELKSTGATKARLYDEVTVMFTDFVDFTKAGEKMNPEELVAELDTCFKAFDAIISKHGIEKIKTIGDAYLAVCGLPNGEPLHAEKIALAALEITDFIARRRQVLGDKAFDIRVGLHSGPVVAGIVGVKKFAYDIWGDTVNTAARMQQGSEPGKINISETTHALLSNLFTIEDRGVVEAKNKGGLKMYFLTGKTG